MVRVLAECGCGDLDVEAVVMVALLGAFGSQPRREATVDAAALIIVCGLLSRLEADEMHDSRGCGGGLR